MKFTHYIEFWRWSIDSGALKPPELDEQFSVCPFYLELEEPLWN